MQVLDKIRLKSTLPGLGNFRPAENPGPNSILTMDDKLIKVLINRNFNMYDDEYRLLKIYIYDEDVISDARRLYKTVGVELSSNGEAIFEKAIKKFRVPESHKNSYILYSSFQGVGTLLLTYLQKIMSYLKKKRSPIYFKKNPRMIYTLY